MNYKPQPTIFIILFKFKKSDLLTFQFDFGDHLENLRQYRVNRKMSYRGVVFAMSIPAHSCWDSLLSVL